MSKNIIIIEKSTQKEYQIFLNKNTGEEYLLCPVCSANRKTENQKIKVLGYNHEKNVARCNHCLAVFYKKDENYKQNTDYKKPNFINNKIDEKTIKHLNNRGLSIETINKLRVSSGFEFMPQEEKEVNTIQFNYYKQNELINIKYKSAKKCFKLYKNAELIFYNYDALLYNNEIIITEGEEDCLSFIESGFENTVSVPNGAGATQLTYLDSCFELFKTIEKVYIATDNDDAGINLRKELIRRIGFDKCYIVTFEDCKDANQYLIKYGKDKLKETIKNAEEVIIEGVVRVIDIEEDIDDLYINGLPRGKLINNENTDKLLSWETSRLAVVTGIPSHGKTHAVDDICVRLNILHKWKVGYFSPEFFPLKLHAASLIEKISGKIFNKEHINAYDAAYNKKYLNDNFYFIKPIDEKYSLENILEKAKYLIQKFGIKIFVLDPFNRLEHQIQSGMSETNYISGQLDKIITFLQNYDILFFLIAHPRKMEKDKSNRYEIPNLYSINGSSNFYNKCDYGMTVYRDFVNNNVQIHVQKVKFKHLGQIGISINQFNINNGRFEPFINNELPPTNFDNQSWLIFDK